jgi:hypothetical protein
LALPEVEFEGDRLPGRLELAADDADDAFEDLFFDFREAADRIAALAFASKQNVDDGEGDGEIELEQGNDAGGREIAGSEVGLFRDALKKFAVGQVLGGNQAAIKHDAQVGDVALLVGVRMSRLKAQHWRTCVIDHGSDAHGRRSFPLRTRQGELESRHTLRLEHD